MSDAHPRPRSDSMGPRARHVTLELHPARRSEGECDGAAVVVPARLARRPRMNASTRSRTSATVSKRARTSLISRLSCALHAALWWGSGMSGETRPVQARPSRLRPGRWSRGGSALRGAHPSAGAPPGHIDADRRRTGPWCSPVCGGSARGDFAPFPDRPCCERAHHRSPRGLARAIVGRADRWGAWKRRQHPRAALA
jgi:hypothetical protein